MEQLNTPKNNAYPIHNTQGGIKRLTATEISAKLVEKTRINLYCNPVEMGKLLNRLGALEKHNRGRKTYMVYEKSYEEIDYIQRTEWKADEALLN